MSLTFPRFYPIPLTAMTLAFSAPGANVTLPAEEWGGGVDYGGSFEQQIAGTLVSSLIGGLFNGLNNIGPSPQELANQQWLEDEKLRRENEIQRNNKILMQAQKDTSALLGNRILPNAPALSAQIIDDGGAVYIGNGTVPAILRKSGAVEDAEWRRASDAQRKINLLISRKYLTADEIKELRKLEAERNALWQRSVSVPGLTQHDRNAIRISLPVIDESGGAVDDKKLIELRETESEQKQPKSILTTMTEASVTFGLQTTVETWGDAKAESLAKGKEGVVKFGDALLVGGLVKSAVKGDMGEAGEQSASWGYGKLATIIPGAGLSVGTAQGVGAVTTATFRHAWDAVVTETDNLVPGFLPEGGAKAWWEELKQEQSPAKRFYIGTLGL